MHPYVDFDFARIIPTCEYGAVYNKNFKGFIDYQLIRRLDASKLNDEYLLATIRISLDKYGKRQTYHICKYDNNKKGLLNSIHDYINKNEQKILKQVSKAFEF